MRDAQCVFCSLPLFFAYMFSFVWLSVYGLVLLHGITLHGKRCLHGLQAVLVWCSWFGLTGLNSQPQLG